MPNKELRVLIPLLRSCFEDLTYKFTTAPQLKKHQANLEIFRKETDNAYIDALYLCLSIMVETIDSSRLTLHGYEKLKNVGKCLPNHHNFISILQQEIDFWVEQFLHQFPTPNIPIKATNFHFD